MGEVLLTCLLRWKRSRKEPSLEKTLTGFGLEGGLEVVERDVEEEATECGVAYPEARRGVVDMVDRREMSGKGTLKRQESREWDHLCRCPSSMSWLRHHTHRPPSPPPWTAAPEQSYSYGRFNEASEEDCERANSFCSRHAVEPSRLLPSSDIDRIAGEGTNAWGLEFHITDPSFTQRQTFQGTILNQSKLAGGAGIVTKVEATKGCKDCCLISNLPLISGLYYRPPARDRGVYFEVTIQKTVGFIAIGDSNRWTLWSMTQHSFQERSAGPIPISDSQGGTG